MWLLEHLAVPASLHDIDGRFVYLNPAAERASGRPSIEWVGRTFLDPLPASARRNVEAHFRRAVEHGEPADFETVFIDAKGQRRGVRAQHLPVRDGDEVIGVVILAFDVRLSAREPDIPISPRLTRRQREVLELVADGLTTAEIARGLTLSTETVRNHVRSVLRELSAHTRPEAVAVAQRLGLLASQPLPPHDNHR
jgi:PAS domain S-box-containing protein